jgi:CBS domain-containing protein
MFIKNIMQTKLATLSPQASIREAARRMDDEKIGCLLITNGESLKGLITDRDITCWLARGGKDPDGVRVSEVMQTDIVSVGPEMDTLEASKIMAENKVRRLPVIGDGKLFGIVTTSDLATFLEEEVDNFFHVEEVYHH